MLGWYYSDSVLVLDSTRPGPIPRLASPSQKTKKMYCILKGEGRCYPDRGSGVIARPPGSGFEPKISAVSIHTSSIDISFAAATDASVPWLLRHWKTGTGTGTCVD